MKNQVKEEQNPSIPGSELPKTSELKACPHCGAVRNKQLEAEWKARNILLLEVSGRGDMLKKEHVNADALDGLVAVQNEFDRLRNIVIRDLVAERDRLLQVLETRAEREMEMLQGVAAENDALVAAAIFARNRLLQDSGDEASIDILNAAISLANGGKHEESKSN